MADKIKAPIDRPLSRSYLREFSGWSTAYPPGVSDPTSLRVMENTMVNRDGSLRVRPGMRYLSYDVAPGYMVDAPGSGGMIWSDGLNLNGPPPLDGVNDYSTYSFRSAPISSRKILTTSLSQPVAYDDLPMLLRARVIEAGDPVTGGNILTVVDCWERSAADILGTEPPAGGYPDMGISMGMTSGLCPVGGNRFLTVITIWPESVLGGSDRDLLAFNLLEVDEATNTVSIVDTFSVVNDTAVSDFSYGEFVELQQLGPDKAVVFFGGQQVSGPYPKPSMPGYHIIDTSGGAISVSARTTIPELGYPGGGSWSDGNGLGVVFNTDSTLQAFPFYWDGSTLTVTPTTITGWVYDHDTYLQQGEIGQGPAPNQIVMATSATSPGSAGWLTPTIMEVTPTSVTVVKQSVLSYDDDSGFGYPNAYLPSVAYDGKIASVWGVSWDEELHQGRPTVMYGVMDAATQAEVTEVEMPTTGVWANLNPWWSGGTYRHIAATDEGMFVIIGLCWVDETKASYPTQAVAGWISFAPPEKIASPGKAVDRPFVGGFEPFYLEDGTKSYLCAVREDDGTVGFRVLTLDVNDTTMRALDDPDIDFELLQPVEVLNFSADTTHVTYLQIDNKIFALSDNGEPMRLFHTGEHKQARALSAITRPAWRNRDKLDVLHPDAAWITGGASTGERRNRLPNPSFEANRKHWSGSKRAGLFRPRNPTVTPVSGRRVLRVTSQPERTNLIAAPLHDVATLGIGGWVPAEQAGEPDITADGSWLRIAMPRSGDWFAHSRQLPGVRGGRRYRVALDVDPGSNVNGRCRVWFRGVNGSVVGERIVHSLPDGTGRWVSPPMKAPKSAVSVQVGVGGWSHDGSSTFLRFKNVVFCPHDEPTAIFTGDSGADYLWTGGVNDSASVYHPPADVTVTADKVPVLAKKPLVGSLYVEAGDTVRQVELTMRVYDRDGQKLTEATSGATADTAGTMTRLVATLDPTPNQGVRADLRLRIPNVARGEYHFVDAAMLECEATAAGEYFDGSTADTATAKNRWKGKRHGSVSVQDVYATGSTIPTEETRTVDTLRSTGGRKNNPYAYGFFYTFNNDVGESAASKIAHCHTQRGWSDWIWETPNEAGEPSGTATNDPEKCADQLVAIMPQDVFDEALAEGAVSWSLYMYTWSDQEPVPVTAVKVGERELKPDSLYTDCGWIRVTPAMADLDDDAPLPAEGNRHNYSDPGGAAQGLVASDRMVLVNDPTQAAVIRWSSNRMGEYTNFTARIGGGYKTLTSGNLYVPAAVKLWQNPMSADTITILCLGTDGRSVSYYMAPGQVTSQTDATNIMGFEETTATPGTTSPFGVEILNNAMIHPLEDQLMKSTASNYNINHHELTEMIANKWQALADKYWIMSAAYDNRLYYLVHNLEGEPLEEGCKGNELWVYDAAAKDGTWSRFLIQGHSLRTLEYGERIYMSVIRPDGVFYLDPASGFDDYVASDLTVLTRPIDWKIESNTQGANKAHDAWAHLHQLVITLGNFTGPMRFGIRGYDANGKRVEAAKQTRVPPVELTRPLPYDTEDYLRVARDLKEWHFFAESVPGEASAGQINLVQYRYTPVSVNVGYELGSVETFEYTRNLAAGPNAYSANGVPLPYNDPSRR